MKIYSNSVVWTGVHLIDSARSLGCLNCTPHSDGSATSTSGQILRGSLTPPFEQGANRLFDPSSWEFWLHSRSNKVWPSYSVLPGGMLHQFLEFVLHQFLWLKTIKVLVVGIMVKIKTREGWNFTCSCCNHVAYRGLSSVDIWLCRCEDFVQFLLDWGLWKFGLTEIPPRRQFEMIEALLL